MVKTIQRQREGIAELDQAGTKSMHHSRAKAQTMGAELARLREELSHSRHAQAREVILRKEIEAQYAKMDVWRRFKRSGFQNQFWSLAEPFHSAVENDPRIFQLVKNTLVFAGQYKIYAGPDRLLVQLMSVAMEHQAGIKNGRKVPKEIKLHSVMLFSRFGKGVLELLN